MMVAFINCAPSFALIVVIFISFRQSLANSIIESVETLSYDEFKSFIDESSVRLVFFKQEVETPNVSSFMGEYALAAGDLKTYGIKLGLVLCQTVKAKIKYCNDDDTNEQFVYGFKKSNEKIALPLETLYDSNSIVSSALHLTLIQSVPIIQQLNERQQLESHCKGKCSIIFTFQRILGTHEHRIFIEAAFVNLNKFLFALTTNEVATIGLRRLQYEGDSNGILEEPAVWVLHCARIERNSLEDCPQSNYRHPIEKKPFLQFLQTISLPDWVIIPKGSNNISYDDYEKSKLHSAYFLYDDSTKENVKMLAPTIGLWFKGTVGVIGIHEKLVILNEYDNAYNFIIDQLRYSSTQPQEIGVIQQSSESLAQLDELQQDDEVAKYLHKYQLEHNEVTNDVKQLTDQTYPTFMKKNKTSVILYYLNWDTVSQIALQVFSKLLKTQPEFKNILYRIDCFEWTDVCSIANITSYPAIHIHAAGQSKLYQGPLKDRHLLLTTYLYQTPNPILLNNSQQVASFISGDTYFSEENQTIKLPAVVLIGMNNDSKINDTIVRIGVSEHGKISLGLCNGFVCAEIIENYSLKTPFAITFRPMDSFQKHEIMDTTFDYYNLFKFIVTSQKEIFPKLTVTNFAQIQETKKPLVILFRNVSDMLDVYNLIGKLLSTKIQPNFNFVWVDVREALGRSIYSAYLASSGAKCSFSILVIDHSKECFYIYSIDDWEMSNPFFMEWLKNIEKETQKPTGILPKGDWKPRLPGFDYLKFIDDDQVKDTEDKSNPEPVPEQGKLDARRIEQFKIPDQTTVYLKPTTQIIITTPTTLPIPKARDRAADARAADHRAADHKAADHKASDHKAADHKAVDHKAADHKSRRPQSRRRQRPPAAEARAAEAPAAEARAAEAPAAEAPAAEAPAAEAPAAEAPAAKESTTETPAAEEPTTKALTAEAPTLKPPTVEPQTVEPQTVEPQTVEPQTVEPQTVEPQTVEPQTVEPQTVEPQTVEPQTVEPQSVEPQSVEPQSVEPQTVEPQSVEPQSVEPQSVEPQTVEPQTVEPQTVEPQTVEPQTVEPQTVEPQTVEPQTVEPQTVELPTAEPPTAEQPITVVTESPPINLQPIAVETEGGKLELVTLSTLIFHSKTVNSAPLASSSLELHAKDSEVAITASSAQPAIQEIETPVPETPQLQSTDFSIAPTIQVVTVLTESVVTGDVTSIPIDVSVTESIISTSSNNPSIKATNIQNIPITETQSPAVQIKAAIETQNPAAQTETAKEIQAPAVQTETETNDPKEASSVIQVPAIQSEIKENKLVVIETIVTKTQPETTSKNVVAMTETSTIHSGFSHEIISHDEKVKNVNPVLITEIAVSKDKLSIATEHPVSDVPISISDQPPTKVPVSDVPVSTSDQSPTKILVSDVPVSTSDQPPTKNPVSDVPVSTNVPVVTNALVVTNEPVASVNPDAKVEQ
uniref:Uncharacterized protein n=1 Tax=Strigamia maritima TaxID=126957 RepID=T1ITS1_STRMM